MSLAIPCYPQVFSTESSLMEHLRREEIVTPVTIQRVTDALMDAHGRIGGYRLTQTALQQFCRRASKGLYLLIRNLAGPKFSRPHSTRLCASVINRVVRDRFEERFLDRTFLFNHKYKRIEAVVRPKYRQYGGSLKLMEAVKRFIEIRLPKIMFCEAIVEGGYLSVRYHQQRTIFTSRSKEYGDRLNPCFCHGWCFGNMPSAHRCEWMAPLMVCSSDMTMAKGRTITAFRLFRQFMPLDEDMRTILEFIEAAEQEAMEHAKAMAALQQERMFAVRSMEDVPQQFEKLRRYLRTRGIQSKVSKDIVNHAIRLAAPPLSSGAHREQTYIDLAEKCSAYHVYRAITIVAKTQRLHARERLESLAHEMLTRRFIVRKE